MKTKLLALLLIIPAALFAIDQDPVGGDIIYDRLTPNLTLERTYIAPPVGDGMIAWDAVEAQHIGLVFGAAFVPNFTTKTIGVDYNGLVNKPAAAKRKETYSGTTNASGVYTVTFATAYPAAPNIQANIINGTDTQNIRTTAISTTGFTVLVRNRTDVVGLLPSWANVNGAAVDVLINEK